MKRSRFTPEQIIGILKEHESGIRHRTWRGTTASTACETDGEVRLLELNPFSGADLYACNRTDLVLAVSQATSR